MNVNYNKMIKTCLKGNRKAQLYNAVTNLYRKKIIYTLSLLMARVHSVRVSAYVEFGRRFHPLIHGDLDSKESHQL